MLFFSTVAVGQGMAFHSAVSAAKGAVEGMSRALAAELAPAIRVNCIAPSLTDTSLAEKLLGSPERAKAAAERHPLKRVGSVDDIASLACFLLGPEAGWITGQVIGVDGGMSRLR
jgi:NAD(P)-dependent dehydrogenase (short-subunit alcohol dehydrogenase family)